MIRAGARGSTGRYDLEVDMTKLSLKNYEITETGLVAHGGWTPELWEAAGREIARYQKGLMWLVGDWLNAGDHEGYVERGRLADACERFGIAYDTALQASRVAAAFKSCLRRQDLGWHHHKEVANHEQAADLLAWAETNGSTVKQLREEKQRRSIDAGGKPFQSTGKGTATHAPEEDVEPNQMLDEISYYALAFLHACPERADELEGLLLTWVSRCKQR